MEKMGIKNDFCICHVIHWILKDSGMYCEFFVEPDKEKDKSVIHGNKIDMEKVSDGVEKYKVVMYEKIRKVLCDGYL